MSSSSRASSDRMGPIPSEQERCTPLERVPGNRELARRVAHILGPSSAASLALAELDRRAEAGEDADIYLLRDTWIVGAPLLARATGPASTTEPDAVPGMNPEPPAPSHGEER